MSVTPILSAVRAALPDDRLRAHMAARALFHVANAVADPASLLSLSDIEQALARGAFPASDLKLYFEDRLLDLEIIGASDGTRLRPLVVRGFARQGATLVLNNLQRVAPHLWALACEAERWLGDPVVVGGIASFGHAALPLHYDRESLIIVQIAGSKHWYFHGEPVPDSARRSEIAAAERAGPVTRELLMQAGDVLFVPSGQYHRCLPRDFSFHLGIIVEHASARALVRQFAPHLDADAAPEKILPRFLGGDALAHAMAEVPPVEDLAVRLAESAARRAQVTGLDLRAPGLDSPEAQAELALTIVPAPTAQGKLRAGAFLLDSIPGVEEVLAALHAGPRTVVSLAAHRAALEMLVGKGVVRIRS